VWVANVTNRTLSEIDAAQPDLQPSFQALTFRPGALAYGDGLVWVINPQTDTVVPVNAVGRGETGDPIAVGAGPIAVAAGGGAAWVASELDDSLTRLAPEGVSARIDLTFSPGALALDVEAEALWIIDASGDRLVRFDTRAREEMASVPIGARPVAVAVGSGTVWVATASGTVVRIDPATNTPTATIEIGGEPRGIAVSGSTAWVAVAEP
jgi:YVTN family beta-propeller protein